MRKLELDNLKDGIGGLTEAFGTFLVEAAMYCLEQNNHNGQAVLQVEGYFDEKFELIWSGRLTEEVKGSWYDRKEATEYGATAIAILLVNELTDYNKFKRTRGGTDYIISKGKSTNTKLSDISYLEISGLWKETKNNTLTMRVNLKRKQVERTIIDASAFVIVTEFGNPKTKIHKQ